MEARPEAAARAAAEAPGGRGGGGSGGGGGISSGGGGSGGAAGATGTGGRGGSAGSSSGGNHGGAGSAGSGAAGSGAAGTTGAGGTAGGGTAGGAGSGGTAGTVCGGVTGVSCSALDWCDYPGDTCGTGAQQGACKPRSTTTGYNCTAVVCGCDGNSYSSECSAHLHGVDTISSKSCIPGNGGAGAPCGTDSDCMTGYKCCTGGAAGTPLTCTQVPAGGQCPLLP